MRWTCRTALLVALCFPPRSLPAQSRPGDDFFGYANAAWLASTTIPDGRDRFTARNQIEATTRQRLDDLFASLASAPPASLGGKVQRFLTAWGRDTSLRAL